MRKLIFLLLFPWLISCSNLSTIPTAKDSTIDKAFESSEQYNVDMQELPSAVTDALIPDFDTSLLDEHSDNVAQFNLSLHDVNARDFFMGLVAGTNENMLVHPDVSGTISLSLKNVTIAQEMDAVQKVYGYDYKKSELGYIVYPSTIQTRIFKLNKLDIKREGESRTSVTSGQNNSANNETTDNSSDSNSSSSSASSTWIKTSSKSNFWQDIEDAINSIIAIDPKATVKINPHVGTIIVRANPMQLREIEQFISITQNQLSRQVIIEAKIIEIILDDNHQSGIDWQEVADTYAGDTPLFNRLGAISDNAGIKFTDYVKMLDTQGKANILSSPRISTLNNQKAIIKVGSDEFFISNVTSTGNTATTIGTTTTSVPTVELSSFFSGIVLDVTPQINDDNYVTLHIHPSITRVQSKALNFTLDGKDSSFPMALNTMRESDSIVRAKNNQVIVIGGLMQEITTEGKDGVPFLTRIPLLGNLFRTNSQSTQKSELVILLKPTIIKKSSDWDWDKDRSTRQLKELQNHELWE